MRDSDELNFMRRLSEENLLWPNVLEKLYKTNRYFQKHVVLCLQGNEESMYFVFDHVDDIVRRQKFYAEQDEMLASAAMQGSHAYDEDSTAVPSASL